MPIINKPIVTHTELHSKNNQPYLSKKRDASINLNGQIRDKNGKIIQCRHISSYWSDLFYNNLGKVNYETLSSPRLLSESISILKEDTGTNNINGEIYFVENELWGSVIYDIFLQMEKKHETHRSLDIHSPGHQMALGIKIKKNQTNKLVVNFYDPNQTATHKRVFFDTENITDARALTAYDFLCEACLRCYGLKEEKLSLFVDRNKSTENDYVSIKKLPGNPLQGVVINFAMSAGLREVIKNICDDTRLVGLTRPQVEALCEAKDVNGVPGLLLALQNGNQDAVEEYGRLIEKVSIRKEQLIPILSARTSDGTIPGLFQALQNNHAQTVRSYGKLVLNTIDNTRDLEYLLSAVKYEPHDINKYFPGLFMAFQRGNAEAIQAYCDVLGTSCLTRSEIIRMLEAKSYAGVPGLLNAYKNGDINTIRTFFYSLISLNIPQEVIEELLTARYNDFTGLSLAISHGHAQVVQLYGELLKKLDTSPYKMSFFLSSAINCDLDILNPIIGSERKLNKAVKEYVGIIKKLGILPEMVTEHLSELRAIQFLDIYRYYNNL